MSKIFKEPKRLLALVVAIVMLCTMMNFTVFAADDTTEIAVFTTTDVHGKVWNQNILTDDTVNNSLLKVSTYIKQQRANYDHVMVLDNGDLYQGTPISTYNILSKGGVGNPMTKALRYIGYDSFTLGNHEYNYSWNAMSTIYSELEAEADANGTPVAVLAANVYDKTTGENIFTPYIIKDYEVDGEMLKVGVIGFENVDCPRWDVPENYPNQVFTHPDNTTQSMAWEAEKYVSEIRDQVDIVIVAYHSGMGSNSGDLEFGKNTENQIQRMINGTNGIDLVIAGHDHSAYQNRSATNKDGVAVPVVNAGGSQLTKSVFEAKYVGDVAGATANGFEVKLNTFNNISLNSVANDADLVALVQDDVDAAVAYVNEDYGNAIGDWTTSTNFKMQQTDTIDLINRAQMWTAEQEGFKVDVSTTTDIISNSSWNIKAGPVSLKNIYGIYKYDNYLYLVEVTGAQLKTFMEGVADYYTASVGSNGNVTYSRSGGTHTTALFYGVSFTYDIAEAKGSGNRVKNLKLADGTWVEEDETYNLLINNYLIGNEPFKVKDNANGIDIDTTDAIWSSQDALGDEDGLVTQMVANFVQAMTEKDGGVAPAPSDWKLGYGVETEYKPYDLAVFSTTDVHGKIWNQNILTDDTVNNSLLKVSTVIKEKREVYGKNMIVIDNGDLYQGTPISTYNILSKGGVGNPMTKALRYIGYDTFTLGNHEYNYSWNAMKTIYDELEADADANGTPVDVLAANIYDKTTGENIFTPYVIKEYENQGKTLKVGIIGFENVDCPRWDVPENYPNQVFTHPDNTTQSMAWEAEKYVSEIRDQVDIVIVAYHSGMGSNSGDLEFGKNTENQIMRMINGTEGIDLVVAGHDHSTYKNRSANNKNGDPVPVVNAGGSQLTQTYFTIQYVGNVAGATPNGFEITLKQQDNISLSSVANDAGLSALVKQDVDEAIAYVNEEYGIATGDWSTSKNYRMEQTDTIDIINRAQIWTAKQNGFDVDVSTTTDIISGSYIVQPGPISLKDIYRLYKYDNYLYLVEVTGAQLKTFMEGVADYYTASVDGDGNVTYGRSGGTHTTALFYGVSFTYDIAEAKGSGERVKNLRLADGRWVEEDETYNLLINNYLIGNEPFKVKDNANGIDIDTTDAIWSSQDALGDEDGLVTQMIANFVRAMTEKNGSVEPASSDWKLGYEVETETPVDWDAFNKAVEKAKEVDSSDYTEDSYQKFQDAIDEILNAVEDLGYWITQDELDAYTAAIEEAYELLKEKEKPTQPPTQPSTDPTNPTETTTGGSGNGTGGGTNTGDNAPILIMAVVFVAAAAVFVTQRKRKLSADQ